MTIFGMFALITSSDGDIEFNNTKRFFEILWTTFCMCVYFKSLCGVC